MLTPGGGGGGIALSMLIPREGGGGAAHAHFQVKHSIKAEISVDINPKGGLSQSGEQVRSREGALCFHTVFIH